MKKTVGGIAHSIKKKREKAQRKQMLMLKKKINVEKKINVNCNPTINDLSCVTSRNAKI